MLDLVWHGTERAIQNKQIGAKLLAWLGLTWLGLTWLALAPALPSAPLKGLPMAPGCTLHERFYWFPRTCTYWFSPARTKLLLRPLRRMAISDGTDPPWHTGIAGDIATPKMCILATLSRVRPTGFAKYLKNLKIRLFEKNENLKVVIFLGGSA